jgi:penicillin-binding protein 2
MNARFEPEGQQPPRHGLILLQSLILGLFCIFALRLWYLQVHKGHVFAAKARDNQLRQEAMYAPRGLIRDTLGRLVAVNEPAYALGIVREDVRDLDSTLERVAGWTGMPVQELRERFETGRKRVKSFEPLVLVPDLPMELLAKIEANTLFWPGLEIIVRPRRFYPQGELLAHVLGYVAEANEKEMEADPELAMGDYVGKGGLEFVNELRLRGDKGLKQMEVDATGRRLNEKVLRKPVAGQDLTLSINLDLQRTAYKQLEGQAGAIVVMEPATGRILAFVSQPSYDNNMFVSGLSQDEWASLRDNPRHPLQNRVVQSMFPPGSVFKLVVGGAALHNGIDTKETHYCSGQIKFGRRIFRCWKKWGHGHVDFKQGLTDSCDVYFYQIGDKLGIDKMSEFAEACGFGHKTGIELPHEKSGLVPTPEWKKRRFGEPWVGGENLNTAIGQGYTLVTPLQVARFIGALVNGGLLMKPQLLTGAEPVVQGSLPLSDEHRQLIVDTMIATVDEGTARRLKRKDAIMGGKTGTAQVVRLKLKGDERRKLEEMPYEERDHAWLASFGSKDGKTYVAVCMVEHGGHGGSAAGPILKEIYKFLFDEKKEGA